MSCFKSGCYLPQPAREWSRVQNSCSLNVDDNGTGLTRVPLTGEVIPVSLLGIKMAMLNKGNILQYKANSSNLTKAQRYSKIAKGQWTNRNTTWATQSTRGYTNPNTTMLKRVGSINIAISRSSGEILGPTDLGISCPQFVQPVYDSLPSNGGGGSDVNEPSIPPQIYPSEESDVFPPIVDVPVVGPIVIQDGGSLLCSVQENPCTGEVFGETVSQQLCNPSSDSDVPGQMELCWNDGVQTWYPRQRYVMTNSANKFPINAVLVSAIKPNCQ